MGDGSEAAIAAVILGKSHMGVAGNALDAEDGAAELHGSIRIEQLGPDHADVVLHCLADQELEPARIVDQGVVVEEDEDVAARCFCAEIVEPGIVEAVGVTNEADGAALRGMAQIAKGVLILRAVVDDNDLHLGARVAGPLLDAGKARLKQIELVLGRDDDADRRQIRFAKRCFVRRLAP